jgi:hypothetical protein
MSPIRSGLAGLGSFAFLAKNQQAMVKSCLKPEIHILRAILCIVWNSIANPPDLVATVVDLFLILRLRYGLRKLPGQPFQILELRTIAETVVLYREPFISLLELSANHGSFKHAMMSPGLTWLLVKSVQ